MNRTSREYTEKLIETVIRRLSKRIIAICEYMLDKNGMTWADIELRPEEVVAFVNHNISSGILQTMAQHVSKTQAGRQLTERKAAMSTLERRQGA